MPCKHSGTFRDSKCYRKQLISRKKEEEKKKKMHKLTKKRLKDLFGDFKDINPGYVVFSRIQRCELNIFTVTFWIAEITPTFYCPLQCGHISGNELF